MASPEQDDAEQDDDQEDDDRPRLKRHATRERRKAVDDEEDEGDTGDGNETLSSLPSVLPRLLSFGAGFSAMVRQFQFNTTLFLKEVTPRTGAALSLEAYPLMLVGRDWFATFGIGASYSLEQGAAAVLQSNGSSSSFPARQQRWSIDLRYALPLGERVVVIPAVGYGASTFDLQRPTPVPPSQCTGMSVSATDPTILPCLADVRVAMLIADLHLRVAATPTFGLSLMGGYLLGLSVGKAAGQIGSEASGTSLSGFHGALGANWIAMDWLALQVAFPFATYAYKFSGGTTTYGSASETYYGVTIGAIVFTR